MWVFFILALVGLIVSIAAHLSTFFGIDLRGFSSLWILLFGVLFIVFLPAIAVASQLPRGDRGNVQPFKFAPGWMRLLTFTVAIYAAINFVTFCFLMSDGSPYEENGQYVVRNHGKLVAITAAEYRQSRVYDVRGFTGHAMFFYAAAMTLLASGIRYRKLAADSGLSAGGLASQQGRWPLWVHTIFAVILQTIGFFAGPALYIGSLVVFHWQLGCFGTLLWVATPWPGLAFALYLLAEKLPAECPNCGGRAFFVSSRGNHYRCKDCGWTGG